MVNELCMCEALLDGAKEVFETMIFMDLEQCIDDSVELTGDCLLGSITFKGNLEGCLSICCSRAGAKVIAANMLGMDPNEDVADDDICDAMGEVANMVMGGVKSRIQDSVGTIEVSIPSVIGGRQLENSMGEGATKIVTKVTLQSELAAELSLLCRENGK